jgi:hypothetical protein
MTTSRNPQTWLLQVWPGPEKRNERQVDPWPHHWDTQAWLLLFARAGCPSQESQWSPKLEPQSSGLPDSSWNLNNISARTPVGRLGVWHLPRPACMGGCSGYCTPWERWFGIPQPLKETLNIEQIKDDAEVGWQDLETRLKEGLHVWAGSLECRLEPPAEQDKFKSNVGVRGTPATTRQLRRDQGTADPMMGISGARAPQTYHSNTRRASAQIGWASKALGCLRMGVLWCEASNLLG